MRMRKKPNLPVRMERCAQVLLGEPEALRGQWQAAFPQYAALHLELGCGKGRFTVETARLDPANLLVAVERVPDAMVVAMERCMAQGLENIRFLDCDVKNLPQIFAPGEVSRIYINFCDPWPKSRDAKHRLTAPSFLRQYAALLPQGGEIHFKTDNAPLFAWSEEQFAAEGWAIRERTDDLHEAGPVGVMTDYEEKFHAAGVPIHRLVAVKTPDTLDTRAGEPPRLRNASLTDARCNQTKEE